MFRKNCLGFIASLFIINVSAQNIECGTPEKASWYEKLKVYATSKPAFSQRGSLDVIPYQIHLIVHADSSTNLTLADVYNEIDTVNSFYANSNMIFVECQAPEIIYDDDMYEYDYNTHESIILNQHYTNDVVNMYFANTVTSSTGSSLCGYSRFPPSEDYVVMAANCATNGSTLAHELGHLFGLPHTHGGTPDELVDGSNCDTEGDYICDTPADPTLSNSNVNTSCVYTGTLLDANGMDYMPDVTNIMSYSRKNCRSYFSPEQYQIINYTHLNDRDYLVCNITETKIIEKIAGSLIYPNPGQDELNFAANEIVKNYTVYLYNAFGELLFTNRINSTNTKVNTSSFANGIYFYKIVSGNYSFNGKWLKN